MIGRLTLSHLNLLVALHRHGSLTEAAAALNLSQSAASHQIREMERRLGLDLFERRKNRLHFTAAGERALASARIIVEEAGDLENAMDHACGRSEAALRIGLRGQNAHWWLARFFAEADSEFETRAVQFVSEVNRLPLEVLRSGDVELAISASSYGLNQFETVDLFSEPLVAAVALGHPLAGQEFVEASDIAGFDYATFSPVHEAGMEYDLFLKPADKMPRRMLLLGSTDACLAFVREGLALSCLPASALAGPAGEGIAMRPMTREGLTVTWRAFLRRNRPDDNAALRLARQLASWCAMRMGETHPGNAPA